MENHDPIEKSITAGQVGKVQELVGAALRKSGLQSKPTQHVLESQGVQVIDAMVDVFCKFVEGVSNMIVRHVSVNRSRSAREAINATGCNKYIAYNVVVTMPQGEGDEADVFFFKLSRYASDKEVEKEYKLRGYKPADPYALATVNEADPSFADEHPNCTHWKDANGNWCYVAFSRRYDERIVNVNRNDHGWDGRWWFAGRRK